MYITVYGDDDGDDGDGDDDDDDDDGYCWCCYDGECNYVQMLVTTMPTPLRICTRDLMVTTFRAHSVWDARRSVGCRLA